jgi:pimeloyl-ACP methyl ester carboxylesterase
MPLIVLTRGMADEKGTDASRREAEHRNDHAALAALSTRGKLVIAERSGHHVQLDQPELVAQAVTDALTALTR